MHYTKSAIFRRTLGEQPAPDEWAVPRARLREVLVRFRERAAVLAGEIHRDLPDFTVHDISHIDALWEMADLLAGPYYPVNPLEAFALGGALLLHDLGLGRLSVQREPRNNCRMVVLARAWGCDYEEVEVSKSVGYYEIGYKEGGPMEKWNVTLLRKPLGQRK